MTTKAETLEKIAEAYRTNAAKIQRRVIVCAGTGCIANGSLKVRDAIMKLAADKGLDIVVEISDSLPETAKNSVYMSRSGCQGFCQQGPLVTIEPDGILYCKVKVDDAEEIVNETLIGHKPVERLLYLDVATQKRYKGQKEIPFYTRQLRTTLDQCGFIDPHDINEYIAEGGYIQARKAFLEMTPEEVCNTILASGLRGKGGGGFPTGRKWLAALAEKGPKKYVICNADEGDPGAFMDRSLMEGDPHRVIEGMMIAARGIGADEGYMYVRAEYPLAVQRVRKAVADATAKGILGDSIFGTEFKFNIHIMEGAGAFVCGEETALMASIEGDRGMPKPKPPFPAQKGLYGCPTVINNVETLGTVPVVIREGAENFRKVGTETSPGTKTFALSGNVQNTGLIEVPFGTTLRHIVFDIGGGVTDDNNKPTDKMFKSVQIGGPSGACLTEKDLDLPLDFDNLKRIGAMVGSGGLVVMNDQTCMVQIARFFMQFTQNESCGKCVLCREGTKQMLHLMDVIIRGDGSLETIKTLEELAGAIQKGSLCALGKTAPNPVLSVLKHFREEMVEHVTAKKCKTRKCKALSPIQINPDKCKGCTMCAKKCPVGAISGTLKQPHHIDENKCIKCGACKANCKFGAID